MDYIFISYDEQNISDADNVSRSLKQLGFEVVMDIEGNDSKEAKLHTTEALKNCSAFIVIMTPEAEKNDRVTQESMQALLTNKPMFPILFDGEVFSLLCRMPKVDATEGWKLEQEFLKRLEKVCKPSLSIRDYVFISHKRENKSYAVDLSESLIRAGFGVWIDTHIKPGYDWEKAIKDALERCTALILVMTFEAGKSEWVKEEYTYALDNNIPVFPVLLKDQEFPRVAHLQYFDARKNVLPDETFFDRLSKVVRRAGKYQLFGTLEQQMGFYLSPLAERQVDAKHLLEKAQIKSDSTEILELTRQAFETDPSLSRSEENVAIAQEILSTANVEETIDLIEYEHSENWHVKKYVDSMKHLQLGFLLKSLAENVRYGNVLEIIFGIPILIFLTAFVTFLCFLFLPLVVNLWSWGALIWYFLEPNQLFDDRKKHGKYYVYNKGLAIRSGLVCSSFLIIPWIIFMSRPLTSPLAFLIITLPFMWYITSRAGKRIYTRPFGKEPFNNIIIFIYFIITYISVEGEPVLAMIHIVLMSLNIGAAQWVRTLTSVVDESWKDHISLSSILETPISLFYLLVLFISFISMFNIDKGLRGIVNEVGSFLWSVISIIPYMVIGAIAIGIMSGLAFLMFKFLDQHSKYPSVLDIRPNVNPNEATIE